MFGKEKDRKNSKILFYLSAIIAVAMFVASCFYICKWHFMGENAWLLFGFLLIVNVAWLILIRLFCKDKSNQYWNEEESAIQRRTRRNMVRGIILILLLTVIEIYIQACAHTVTSRSFQERLIKDEQRIRDIQQILEIACYEMDYFYADSQNWQETKKALEAGVDITEWGTPKGDFQKNVANPLGITDFSQLKEEFLTTDGVAIIQVKLEGEEVTVQLLNLYPVADRAIIVK